MSGRGKQAKILTDKQVAVALRTAEAGSHASADRVKLLLSLRAGLRAKEIALLTWSMVTDAEGQVGSVIALPNKASKGRSGRIIPLHPDLRESLLTLAGSQRPRPGDRVVKGARGQDMTATSVQVWFHRFYQGLGWEGASSHSGRRTWITKLARKAVEAGGSLRDVQELSGHASLSTTQRYIQGDSDAKRRMIEMM
jgi:integrase